VACLPDPSGNPRSYRAAWLLDQMGFEVWTLSPNPKNPIPFLKGSLTLDANPVGYLQGFVQWIITKVWRLLSILPFTHGLSESLLWRLIGGSSHLATLRTMDFKLILVEDLPILNLILDNVGGAAKVIFDSREYFPREFDSSLKFNMLDKPRFVTSLHKSIPRLDAFYTVCRSIALEYEKDFGRRPDVVLSTPFYSELKSREDVSMPVRMVHHGVANRSRGLENMILSIGGVGERYTLDLYLVGDPNYIHELTEMSRSFSNVFLRDPVSFRGIHDMLCAYDLGFSYIQPDEFNYLYALPNKLFEYIQAGLGVIVGPSPEMSSIVIEFGCGAVSGDFSVQSMVELLSSLSDSEIIDMKRASRVASEVLCWEVESGKLEKLIHDSLKDSKDSLFGYATYR
jgi:glycosyltransferase involved in cell wall biosynthesis